jgi:hypothetical protein
MVVVPGACLWDRGQHSKLNYSTLLGRSWPNRATAEEQCRYCLLQKTTLTALHELAGLSHLTIPTNLVNRRDQILLTNQSPGKTTSELLLVCQYEDWTPKEKLQNFYQMTELSEVPEHGIFYCVSLKIFFYYSCIINFRITILLSLILPSSLSLLLLCYNPLFSLLITLSAPSYALFPPSSLSPPILSQPVSTLLLPPTHSPPAV